MNEVEDELICCVCLELYNTPVLLPCSHNLCKTCVRDLINSNAQRHTFDCPKCRHEVRLRSVKSWENLPENTALKNIVCIVKKRREERGGDQAAVSRPVDIKLCAKHKEARARYCRTCRSAVCDICVVETHTGFGHNVVDTDSALKQEQEKAERCLQELTTIQARLTDHHKQILERKAKLMGYEQSLLKAVDLQFQQLLLSVSMTKIALSSAPLAIRRRHDGIVKEERKCQDHLGNAEQVLKMYESSQRSKDPAHRIQKLENFMVQQSGFVTFQMNDSVLGVGEEPMPNVSLEGMNAVTAALSRVKWSIETDSTDVVKQTSENVTCKNTNSPSMLQKWHNASSESQVAAPSASFSSSKDKSSSGDISHLRAAPADYNCNVTSPASLKIFWKAGEGSVKSAVTDEVTPCVRRKEAVPVLRRSSQMAALSSATVTTSAHQGEPNAHSTLSCHQAPPPLSSLLCCRSKRQNKSLEVSTCTDTRSLGVSACPNTRPPGVNDADTEGATVLRTIQQLDSMLDTISIHSSDTSPDGASHSPEPHQIAKPNFVFSDSGFHHNLRTGSMKPIIGNGYHRDAHHHDNDLTLTSSNHDNSVSSLATGSAPAANQHQTPINHAENSPFRVTEYYKSLSDPAPSRNLGLSEASEAEAADQSAQSCVNGTPPTWIGSSPTACGQRPSLRKSLSVDTSPANKPLFTIGTSPPTGKVRKNYQRKAVRKP